MKDSLIEPQSVLPFPVSMGNLPAARRLRGNVGGTCEIKRRRTTCKFCKLEPCCKVRQGAADMRIPEHISGYHQKYVVPIVSVHR